MKKIFKMFFVFTLVFLSGKSLFAFDDGRKMKGDPGNVPPIEMCSLPTNSIDLQGTEVEEAEKTEQPVQDVQDE